ncbi:MAG TPA: glycosyltransferase family 39 protein [Candidatus Saccharimonadales bacterium]|nr:glycosyltransferase family 39 protein [Candidatus Saccharimonadales bacterium]
MPSKNFNQLLVGLLSLFFVGWSLSVVFGHPTNAVISFDEGFHGGTALYLTEVLRSIFHGHGFGGLGYLRGEFNNGIIFYPPLWNAVAGVAGWIFGPTTAVFRLVTLVFGLATSWLIYFFVRRHLNARAAFIAAVVLLSAPLFYIYSHLMMLEVPLAFGVALALLAYYDYLTTETVGWQKLLLVALAFAVGVQGKIIGIALIAAVLGLYGLALLVFWRRDNQFKRFFALPTLLFVAVATLSWYAYIWAVKHFLHADMLGFFLGQSKGITQGHLGPLGNFAVTVWQHKFFYWRDFSHYPLLALVWFGSLVGFAAWKRTPFSVFLVAYALGVWIIFSGVAPQEVQYLLPIFVPLAIGTGAFLAELAHLFKPTIARQSVLIGLAVAVVWLSAGAVKRSEAQGWRYNVTDQELIASYIAQRAKTGDRVIAWSDATIYAVRVAGYSKRLQIYNGGNSVCPNAMATAIDWAVIEPDGNGSGNQAADLKRVNGWEKAREFKTSGGVTYLFHNPSAGQRPLVTNAIDVTVDHFTAVADPAAAGHAVALLTQSIDYPNLRGCYRLLSLGNRTLTIRLKAGAGLKTVPPGAPVALLEISQLGGQTVSRPILASELKTTAYQDFWVTINANKIDSLYEFKVWSLWDAGLTLDTLTLR